VSGARASLHDNLRPVTPGDLPRHLFSGDDYTNRPGSSYKMKNVVGQAIDEFTSAVGNTTATSSMSRISSQSSGVYKSIAGSAVKQGRADSQSGRDTVLEVLQKAELTMKSRPNVLPALDPLGATKTKPIKGFETGKPIKVVQQQTEPPAEQQLPPKSEPKKLTVKKVNKKPSPTKKAEEDDFADLMKAEMRMEDCMRFDQSKLENL